MRLFGKLYERALGWAKHPHAERYLALLSFVEAFIFPVMPEVMLAPMMLARRERAFRYANVSLLFSLLGSLVGYALGHYAFEALRPVLDSLHLLAPINTGRGKPSREDERALAGAAAACWPWPHCSRWCR